MTFVATATTGILGYGLIKLVENVVLIGMLHHEKGEIEHLFKVLPLVAVGLFSVGLFIIAAGMRKSHGESKGLTPKSAALIGRIDARGMLVRRR